MKELEKKFNQIIGSIAPYKDLESASPIASTATIDVKKLEFTLKEIVGLLDQNLIEALHRLKAIQTLLGPLQTKDALTHLEDHLNTLDKESAYQAIEQIVQMLNSKSPSQ